MISINQAREILGERAVNMTDEQIRIVIDSLTRLAARVIDQVVNNKSSEQMKNNI